MTLDGTKRPNRMLRSRARQTGILNQWGPRRKQFRFYSAIVEQNQRRRIPITATKLATASVVVQLAMCADSGLAGLMEKNLRCAASMSGWS